MKMQKEIEETVKFLDKLKEALYQERYYSNNRITELIQRIEAFKAKIVMESWLKDKEEGNQK
jgi:prefoldin subunit 5